MRAKLVVGESQLRAGHAIGRGMRAAHEAAREAAAHAPVSDFESAVGHVAKPRSASRPSRTPRPPTTWRSRSRPTSRSACSSSPRTTAAIRAAPVRRGHAHRADRGRVRGARPAADAAAHRRLQGGPARRPGRAATPLPHRRDAGLPPWPSRSPCAATRPCACPSCSTSLRARSAPMTRPSAPLRSSRSSAAARRARASSTTSPTPSRPGTSTRHRLGQAHSRGRPQHAPASARCFQVYRVGTSNVPRSFETTPWSGTYGKHNHS